ncbi:MAG: hypothetical protein KBD83_03490 [Gammaproteobacteria bacterium]|nr:hypothetical protein [Gammaproteobacteria bacterium]
MLNTLKTQSTSLKLPWLVKYLPDPAAITPVEAARVEPARKFLFGDSATSGMFPPPVTPSADRELPSTPAAPSLSKKEDACLIR